MICNLDELKQVLNIVDNTTSDDLLYEILKRSEKEAKRYCNRDFEVANYTEYYNGDNSNKLFLRQYPVVSVTSIYDDTDRAYGASTLIDSDDYVIFERDGYVELDGFNYAKGLKNIKITYRAGYGTGTGETAMPDDIKNAVINLAVAEFLESQGSINAVTGQVMDYSTKRKKAYDLLDKYRRLDH